MLTMLHTLQIAPVDGLTTLDETMIEFRLGQWFKVITTSLPLHRNQRLTNTDVERLMVTFDDLDLTFDTLTAAEYADRYAVETDISMEDLLQQVGVYTDG